MPLLTRLPVLALAAASALALPAAAGAQTPTACPLQAPRAQVEHPIAGTDLVARDPYGGQLARNRLFFSFSVRGGADALAKVAKVQWSLDGTVVREDPTLPFQWAGQSGSTKRMPAGRHTITVTVVPKSGEPASTQFPLEATNCQNAAFDAWLDTRRGAASLSWAAAYEDTGEPLTRLTATAVRNVATALPRSLRGKAIGTLRIGSKTYTLKGARTALARGKLKVTFIPGAKTFLKVTGLPAGTQNATVKLKRGVAWVKKAGVEFRVDGGLSAASGSVAVRSGGTIG